MEVMTEVAEEVAEEATVWPQTAVIDKAIGQVQEEVTVVVEGAVEAAVRLGGAELAGRTAIGRWPEHSAEAASAGGRGRARRQSVDPTSAGRQPPVEKDATPK